MQFLRRNGWSRERNKIRYIKPSPFPFRNVLLLLELFASPVLGLAIPLGDRNDCLGKRGKK